MSGDSDGSFLDLLEMLDDGSQDGAEVSLGSLFGNDLDDALISNDVPLDGEEQLVHLPNLDDGNDVASNRPVCRIPSMKGKVGGGRHGTAHERSLLAYHMRHAKALKRNHDFKLQVTDLLQDSCFTKDGKMMTIRAKTTATGVVLSLERKSKVGNRYRRVIPWNIFLQAAYSKLLRSSHISMALDVSQRSVSFMSTLVSQIFMNQQLTVLAKLIAMASFVKPYCFVRQIKWDETQLLCCERR